MKFLKKCSLGLLIAIPLLMPIDSAATKQKQKKLTTLTMGISLAGREPFIVPLSAGGRKTAVLRVSGDDIYGVKVVGWMKDGLARFEVSTILDKMDSIASCDQLKKLRTELVGSYSARKGDTVPISNLKKAGLTSLQVTFSDPIETECPSGCCCCKSSGGGTTQCCPTPPNCMGCSNCGLCCNS